MRHFFFCICLQCNFRSLNNKTHEVRLYENRNDVLAIAKIFHSYVNKKLFTTYNNRILNCDNELLPLQLTKHRICMKQTITKFENKTRIEYPLIVGTKKKNSNSGCNKQFRFINGIFFLSLSLFYYLDQRLAANGDDIVMHPQAHTNTLSIKHVINIC